MDSRGVNSDKWLKMYLPLTFSLSYWNNSLDIGIELDPYRDEFGKYWLRSGRLGKWVLCFLSASAIFSTPVI